MGIIIGTVVVITVGTVVFLLIWWRIADHWIAQEKDRRFASSHPADAGPPPTVVRDPNTDHPSPSVDDPPPTP